MENPPENYLQYIPLWVQIRDIPVNCYTTVVLTALGDLVGKTVVVVFDPTKPITQDFIRVLVKFNVAHPLRVSRTIALKGVPAVVRFNYEKVHKRCFTCQRLNHEKDYCPLNVKKRQEEARLRREVVSKELEKQRRVLQEDDALYGILTEEKVGIDPATGRSKIAKEVLEEMMRYMLTETGDCRELKVDKIKRSVKVVEKDYVSQRLVLRLKSSPLVTSYLNRDKGVDFDYEENRKGSSHISMRSNPKKLMASSFRAYSEVSRRSHPGQLLLCDEAFSDDTSGFFSSSYPTVFKAANFAPSSSRISQRKKTVRKRPPKSVRQQRNKDKSVVVPYTLGEQEVGSLNNGSKKRKISPEEEGSKSNTKEVCRKPVSSFKFFAEMLSTCGMEELPSRGDRFTWGGTRWKKYIRCCLDHCFGNKAWRERFPASNQVFLDKRGSDHRPVLVNFVANPEAIRGQFRFDKRLLHHPDLKKEVEVMWRKSKTRGSMAKRKRRFNAKDKINLFQERLEWFQSKPYSCYSQGQEHWSDVAKAKVVVDYFTELFTSSNPPSYNRVFQSMAPRVTPLMNSCLTIGNGHDTLVWLDKWVYDPMIGMRVPWIKNITFDDKQAWPWICWYLWKSRNDFMFNGVRWTPTEIILKAQEEAEAWFLAQVCQNARRWSPPEPGWLMCNVAFEWNKDTRVLGTTWVVRNHRGVVISHSRRAFSDVGSLEEAHLSTCLWALESMTSMHYNRVVFTGDFKELFSAFRKPHEWPAWRFQVEEMNWLLVLMEEYQLKVVRVEENRGASFIAQSVTRQGRNQSYVVQGHPDWLFEFFVNENRFL
ncbi:hypothetical protein Bca52824_016044 [Brassica carinata]|uniref:RNase H type-1 domain-containing protein n=1 Tax=Brassica carinata TaxID=52824 RepID=A0A8X7W3S3_BRACI|nr:hypothetical protein Bca52824_016044 [Brassica carinata]